MKAVIRIIAATGKTCMSEYIIIPDSESYRNPIKSRKWVLLFELSHHNFQMAHPDIDHILIFGCTLKHNITCNTGLSQN